MLLLPFTVKKEVHNSKKKNNTQKQVRFHMQLCNFCRIFSETNSCNGIVMKLRPNWTEIAAGLDQSDLRLSTCVRVIAFDFLLERFSIQCRKQFRFTLILLYCDL